MTLKEIVRIYLEANGFDGLFNYGICGCTISNLFPCDMPNPDCEPGYKIKCVCGEGCDFDIAKDKPLQAKVSDKRKEKP